MTIAHFNTISNTYLQVIQLFKAYEIYNSFIKQTTSDDVRGTQVIKSFISSVY